MILRAFYGLGSSATSFQKHLDRRMRGIYFNISLADTDTRMKPSVKPFDYKYY